MDPLGVPFDYLCCAACSVSAAFGFILMDLWLKDRAPRTGRCICSAPLIAVMDCRDCGYTGPPRHGWAGLKYQLAQLGKVNIMALTDTLNKYWTEASAAVGIALTVATALGGFSAIFPASVQGVVATVVGVLTWVSTVVFHRASVAKAAAKK